ncbi:MAG TPA: DUF983 domain-containing protein, partial [Actinomycetota bacterium]|nr:DUF983 domain-containing protein [Actinomycetota bacterium]
MLEPDDGSGAEPRREGKRPGPTEPGPLRVLARGARARCPRCAAGALFDGWFHIRERCPRCRLRLEREEGGFLGAMTVNYSVTTLSWLILLGVWLAVDLPDVHVLALTVTSL